MPTLNWIGKDKVVNHHLDVPFYTLEHKYGFWTWDETDTSETQCGNMIIHGNSIDDVVDVHELLEILKGIYDHYLPFSPKEEFVHETLLFLEENRNIYPDAYESANQIYLGINKSDSHYFEGPALELLGIIKGIATLNEE